MIPSEASFNPTYYTTYFGDIYHGIPVDLRHDSPEWFILSLNQLSEYRNLQAGQKTLEKLRELAWEIRDDKIINWEKVYSDGELGNKDNHLDLHKNTYRQRKKLFIFGAGASANCIIGNPKTTFLKPPLGTDLFDEAYEEIVRKYPGACSNISYFEQNGRDIEVAMEKEWSLIRDKYSPQTVISHINLQYYLYDLFNTISNNINANYRLRNLYNLFAKGLLSYLSGKEREAISIVSFNYDTLLEGQISSIFHTQFNGMQDYLETDSRPISLFKPHGSCNWGWQFNKAKIADIGTMSISDYLLKKRYTLDTIYYDLLGRGDIMDMVANDSWGHEQMLNKHNKGRYSINKNKIQVIPQNSNEKYYPALLLPYRDKDDFAMHNDLSAELGHALPEAEEVYIIGWKGTEEVFNRFWKHRQMRLKKLVIVNPVEAKSHEVEKNLREAGINLDNLQDGMHLVTNFEEFISKLDQYL